MSLLSGAQACDAETSLPDGQSHPTPVADAFIIRLGAHARQSEKPSR
ncbi:hypothetical protein HMPREF0972_01471 [Actinomyces sp. oral taxon 848 str. F0332]|nr:hypothetical protein HMPREF0972_01471 [Actinomyces sp. oral taxon 848 str. F0332]